MSPAVTSSRRLGLAPAIGHCRACHAINSAHEEGKGLKRLVVTADDFGLSLPVNEAVEQAHRTGILTAASLMVGAPAFDDAVDRARRLPALGVGLHLTLIDGRPVLPPEQVQDLVGPDGRFPSDPVRFGVALFFSARMRRQAEDEIGAQFDRFRTTGLRLDHVNAHQHFHLHPVVAGAIARIAPAFGAPPVRVPLEPFRASFEAAGDRPLARLLTWLFFLPQTQGLRRRLAAARLPANDRVFGLNDSGAVTESRVLGLLDRLPDGISELYCHPATRRWTGPDNLPASYRPAEELAALVSPSVRAKAVERGVELMAFRAAVAGAS
jgi:hopanoid biosynthesis associated protein HpnK